MDVSATWGPQFVTPPEWRIRGPKEPPRRSIRSASWFSAHPLFENATHSFRACHLLAPRPADSLGTNRRHWGLVSSKSSSLCALPSLKVGSAGLQWNGGENGARNSNSDSNSPGRRRDLDSPIDAIPLYRRKVFRINHSVGNLCLALALVGSFGCLEKGDETPGPIPNPPTAIPPQNANSTGRSWFDRMGPCNPPEGMSGEPESIDDLVAYINAMDHPLSLDCFLQSLDRPLRMSTTMSFFSAQPAIGRRSPRIFLFEGPLILSVVPEGEASALLEMGEERGMSRSIKAEIAFPVLTPLSPEAPFERLVLAEVTACGVCHDQEVPIGDIDGAVISERLRPRVNEIVPVTELHEQYEQCDASVEASRCSMLTALFGHGQVVEQNFPKYLPTIFD